LIVKLKWVKHAGTLLNGLEDIMQGMTQAEVAKATKLNTNYYARVERDEETLSMKTLKAICKVLKVKSSDILDF
jgi:transcriptional regulator with XRE-family HTH domain